ncbi:MAG: hypothetical protein V3W06_02190 [Acidimicrobiia bacterium]
MLHPRHRIDAQLSAGSVTDAIGDYSSTPTRFIWTPLEGRTAHIYRLLVFVQDTGAFDAAKYGNNITLTNGIALTVRNVDGDATVHDYTPGRIFTSGDWAARAFDADVKTWGVGDEILVVRWTFSRAGSPIALTDDLYLSVDLNDVFTGLNAHRFTIQGEYV